MASTTINTTAAEDAIIAPNIGIRLSLGRNATQAEVKQFLIDYLRKTIVEVRTETAVASGKASVPTDGGINPT